MTKLIGRTLQNLGEVVIEEKVLGKGGEGSVYLVTSHELPDVDPASTLVAKIYHNPEEGNRGKKVAAMLQNPPEEQESIAWVKALLFTPNKKFAGYLMQKLDVKNFRQWSELSNSKDRKQTAPNFDVKYGLNASRNFLLALDSVHEAGHRIGDINESNLFVNTNSTVMLVDMDSAQIQQGTHIYPCEVGKPMYVSSEISHGKLRDNPRTVESDIFAYTVMLFQMLTGGAHPMDGIYQGNDDPPDITQKIREGVLPTLEPGKNKKYKPVPRIPAMAIPSRLRTVMINALSPDPLKRPDTRAYLDVMDDVYESLVQCPKDKRHWFDKRDGKCGWCAHKDAGNVDPWGDTVTALPKKPAASAQSALPSVPFAQQSGPAKAPRAAPASAPRQQAQNAPQAPQNVSNAQSPAYGSQQPQNTGQGFGNNAVNSPYANMGPGTGGNSRQGMPYRPDPPRLHKGKLVLEYMDGSMRPRPPMSALLRNNRGVLKEAVIEEYPGPIRIWWDKYRYTPKIPALIIGLIIGLAIAVGWQQVIPMLNNFDGLPQTAYNEIVLFYVAKISLYTSAAASILLFLTALRVRGRDKKRFGKDGIQEENFVKTVLRFIPVGLFYGPLFLIILLLGIIIGIINFASAVVKAT